MKDITRETGSYVKGVRDAKEWKWGIFSVIRTEAQAGTSWGLFVTVRPYCFQVCMTKAERALP
jgi:hypothetical protein